MEPQPQSKGRPLAVDRDAQSARPGVPAFLARPADAPVYHGFPIVDGVEVDGFRLGMISDFLARPMKSGDAFVVAPDGSRAGLVWEAETSEPYFDEAAPPSPDRWGVWAVGLPQPLTTLDDARAYLTALLPELRQRWQDWRAADTSR